jgi:hypothetical protein
LTGRGGAKDGAAAIAVHIAATAMCAHARRAKVRRNGSAFLAVSLTGSISGRSGPAPG